MHTEQGGIVTPEGVVLELDVAGVGSRALAKAVDLVVLIVFSYLVSFAAVIVMTVVPALGLVAAILSVVVVLLGYPVVLETFWNGRTIGKFALGLRVVTTEGAPLRFRHAAIRALLGLAELYLTLGAVAAISALCTRHGQRFGDLAAGTFVVHERARTRRAFPMAFTAPPGWERYAASLDVSAVRPEEYGLVRSYLARVTELTPAARLSLATRIANPLVRGLGSAPPPQLGPELFLVCVAAAYQRRHGGPLPPPPSQWLPPPP